MYIVIDDIYPGLNATGLYLLLYSMTTRTYLLSTIYLLICTPFIKTIEC